MVRVHATARLCRVSRRTGKCNIEFAISHKGQTKYISTNVECQYENFVRGRISNSEPDAFTKNLQLDNKLNDIKCMFGAVKNPLLYNLQDLITLAETISDSAVGQHPTLFAYMDHFANVKRKAGSVSYANMLARGKVVFADWMDSLKFNGDIRLEDLNSTLINNWKDWMLGMRGLSVATTGMYLSHLKAMVNYAIKNNAVEYVSHPFNEVKIEKSPVRRSDLSIEDFIKFRDANLTSEAHKRVRDIWMISFYLCGMNYADMVRIQFPKEKKVVEYCRQKTEHKVTDKIILPICREARELMGKYMDADGYLRFPYNGKHDTNTFCHKLKEIAKELDLPSFCFYTARKTFGQMAYESGLSTTTIDYLLGHSTTSQGVIRHYVHEDVKVLAKAVRQVYDYVKVVSEDDDAIFDCL